MTPIEYIATSVINKYGSYLESEKVSTDPKSYTEIVWDTTYSLTISNGNDTIRIVVR